MPDVSRLWTLTDVATYLGIASKCVYHHLSTDYTFPRPIVLPNGRGGNHHPRWKPGDIMTWVDRYYEQPFLEQRT